MERHVRLAPSDYKIAAIILLLQGALSGVCAAWNVRGFIVLAFIELIFPWSFVSGWSWLLAPQSNYFNVLEAASWASLPVMLNLAIAALLKLVYSTVGRASSR